MLNMIPCVCATLKLRSWGLCGCRVDNYGIIGFYRPKGLPLISWSLQSSRSSMAVCSNHDPSLPLQSTNHYIDGAQNRESSCLTQLAIAQFHNMSTRYAYTPILQAVTPMSMFQYRARLWLPLLPIHIQTINRAHLKSELN